MPRQAFLRLVEEEQEVGAVFGPEELALLTRVFDQVLVDLKLVKRDDPIVTMVAKVIISLCDVASATLNDCARKSSGAETNPARNRRAFLIETTITGPEPGVGG